MAEENNSTDFDKPKLSLSDTIYTAMGIPEIQTQILVLFSLQSKVLSVLWESGLLRKEQVEQVINYASEHIANMVRNIQENAESDRERIAEVAERMQKEATEILNGIRERLNLSS